MTRRKSRTKNNIHNKFYSTVNRSMRFRAEDDEDPEFEEQEEYTGPGADFGEDIPGRGGRVTPRKMKTPRYTTHELYNINRVTAHELGQHSIDRLAGDAAYYKTRAQMFTTAEQRGPASAELEQEWRRPRTTKGDIAHIERGHREQAWRTASGIYKAEPGKSKSPGAFIQDEMPHGHREWVNKQLEDPNSEFNKGLDTAGRAKTGKYTSAQRRRLSRYTNALQRGSSHDEALEQVRRSRLKEGVGRRPESVVRSARVASAQEVLARPKPSGRESKFKSLAPTHGEYRYGVDASTKALDMTELKRRFPNASESELIQVQQAGTELVSQQLLANQKWAHETRRANLLGQKSGRGQREDPDKVTIFTTNLGHPAVSVPSDSLVGQYIIRKRKSILGGYGVPSSQLRGKFPEAVRDAHIIDVATGASIGVQGRQGIFNSSGFRVGKKASAGYGKPRPLGAHILYDTSTGRPLYDSQGNIRYSEGATRPVDWTTPNVGARVLIG